MPRTAAVRWCKITSLIHWQSARYATSARYWGLKATSNAAREAFKALEMSPIPPERHAMLRLHQACMYD